VGTKLTNGRMGEWDIFENIHQCVVNHHSSCEIKLFLQWTTEGTTAEKIEL
jgi:hypothetical protein